MFINAHYFPGPAIYQALMILLLSLWAAWLYIANPEVKTVKIVTAILILVAVVLLAVILKYIG